MMAEIECTHPARITGKDGRLVCLTCGKIVVPEKPAKKTEKAEKAEKTEKTEEKAEDK